MTDYAIVLVQCLARADGQAMSSQALAQQAQLPAPTVSKLLKILTKNDIAVSSRGAQGGYVLAHQPANISVWQVMQAVEGVTAVAKCLEDHNACVHASDCMQQSQWQALNHLFRGILERINFSQLQNPLALHPLVAGCTRLLHQHTLEVAHG